MTMKIVDISKQRMETAFNAVSKITKYETAKEFESYVSKLPAYILTNGIGNTFAYLAAQLSKKKNTWEQVVDAIYNWLINPASGFSEIISKTEGDTNAEKLINLAICLNSFALIALKEEVLAYLNWLRKFAKAQKIKLEKNEKVENNG